MVVGSDLLFCGDPPSQSHEGAVVGADGVGGCSCYRAQSDPSLFLPCYVCGKQFNSITSLTSHCTQAHAFRNDVRRFVGSSKFPVCSVDYKQRHFAIIHLSRTKCRRKLDTLKEIDAAMLQALDEADLVINQAVHKAGGHRNRRPRT